MDLSALHTAVRHLVTTDQEDTAAVAEMPATQRASFHSLVRRMHAAGSDIVRMVPDAASNIWVANNASNIWVVNEASSIWVANSASNIWVTAGASNIWVTTGEPERKLAH